MRTRIPIKSPKEIERMRESGRTASDILQQLAAAVAPGVSTKEIDNLAADLMEKNGCKSAFLGYRGFTGQICISVNEEVVHGIGGPRRIQPGDILKIDVGIIKAGFIGDNATTIACGEIPLETKRLLAVTEQSLYEAISKARPGRKLADLCGAVAEYAEPFGFSIVREFVGHGVGRKLHEEPQVPNYGKRGSGPKLKAGMTLAIEPMITLGSREIYTDEDGWTVRTRDGKVAVHFEHDICVKRNKALVLSDYSIIEAAEKANPHLNSAYY